MGELEKWYRAYCRDIYCYLLGLTQDPMLAEDLLAETFLQALLSMGRFARRSSEKTWLMGIGRNLWLRQLRKRGREIPQDVLAQFPAPTPGDALAKAEQSAALKRCLAALPARQQRVVLLRQEGLTYTQIAKQLEISENSARVIEFRARCALREALIKEGYDES
ncbi:MAG: RNA polymerase sigma factor [Eubacteriales bacterium]|nr:RNA polymerase sigma factor [Eubacteriales bacterium]